MVGPDVVGRNVGDALGVDVVGFMVGFAVGTAVGTAVGLEVGSAVGLAVGSVVGGSVGAGVGAGVGEEDEGVVVGPAVAARMTTIRLSSPSSATMSTPST